MENIVNQFMESFGSMKTATVKNALFVYDGPLQKDAHQSYYSTIFDNAVFNRYLGHAEHLTMAMRAEPFADTTEAQKSKKIDHPHVSIVEVPNLSTACGILFHRGKVRDVLRAEMEKADLAIIRLPSFIGAEAVGLARKLGIKYLLEIVGCPWDSLWNYGIKGKIMAPYLVWAMKSQVRQAPYVIYVTKHFLQKRYPTNGTSTNCSNVEIGASDESVLARRLRHIDTHRGNVILGTAAAVNVPYKGHQYVIEALAELKKQGLTHFRYQMAGGGNRERLEKIIAELGVEDQVEFMGVLTHDKVFEWLDSIDLYIQPSLQEGLPRALIEAMSRALPCLGAKTGGIPELLPDSKIFSNSSTRVREICVFLKALNKEEMEADAIRNFHEAEDYETGKIRQRRRQLLDSIISQHVE